MKSTNKNSFYQVFVTSTPFSPSLKAFEVEEIEGRLGVHFSSAGEFLQVSPLQLEQLLEKHLLCGANPYVIRSQTVGVAMLPIGAAVKSRDPMPTVLHRVLLQVIVDQPIWLIYFGTPPIRLG